MLKFRYLFTIVLLLLVQLQAACSTESNYFETTTVRGLHIVPWHVTYEEATRVIELAEQHKYNTLFLQLREGVVLDTAPWTPMPTALRKSELKALIQFAKNKGFTVIPEIKLLTHQEKYFQNNYPELMFNAVTYDPRLEETYSIVFPFLDEVIELFEPVAIHIGHDESPGWDLRFRYSVLDWNDEVLPAELYLSSIETLNKYITDKGLDVLMWGDMLLPRSEFPNMAEGGLHGGMRGFGTELRKKIPNNVIVVDWHYTDQQAEFPSIDAIVKDNLRVIGAPFESLTTTEKFSRYAAANGAMGMIATTWYLLPQEKWERLEDLIIDSAAIFNEHFPDAE